jgi:hypothetical protein
MCKHYGEPIDHLLLHCEIATELWNVFFQLLGVSWVMPRKVSDSLGSWREQLGNRRALHMEAHPIMCDVVSMARTECTQF